MTEYRTLSIRLDELQHDHYKATVRGAAGDGEAEFDLRFDGPDLDGLAAAISRPRSTRRRIESDESVLAREFGARLFDLIFQHSARDVLRTSLSSTRSENVGLRLMIQLEGAPRLRNVPWELLWDNPRFISTSSYTPVVRYVDIAARRRPLDVQPPLRILGMVSSPGDMPALNAEHEEAQLTEACRSLIDHGSLKIDWVENATLDGLLARLNEDDYHIFHFIGHGDFDETREDGVLLFEAPAGLSQRVTGVELATILADERTLRLAVINACEGARVALDSSGIAATLMQYGLPAVIAMQFEISDDAAICFAQHFYQSLARNHPIDEALADSRRAMFANRHGLEWATPVLFTSIDDGRLFDFGWDMDDDSRRSRRDAATTAGASAPARKASVASPGPSDPDLASSTGQAERRSHAAAAIGWKRALGGDDVHRRRTLIACAVAVVVATIAVVALVVAGVFSGSSEQGVEPSISVGRSPVGIAVGQGKVWVTSSDVGKVSLIDPRVDKVVGTVFVGGDPNSVAVEKEGYVWVANFKSNQISQIDPDHRRLVISRPVGSKPNTLAVGLGAVWVANSGENTVSRVGLRSGSIRKIPGVAKHPTGITVGLGSVWVVGSGEITQIDPQSHAVKRGIFLQRSTQGIAIASNAIWVTNPAQGTVSRIDPASARVVDTIAVGKSPKGIVAAPSGIWVANSGDETLSRINPSSDRLIGSAIKVGGPPDAIAAGQGRIWVTNLENSTVTPIRP